MYTVIALVGVITKHQKLIPLRQDIALFITYTLLASPQNVELSSTANAAPETDRVVLQDELISFHRATNT